MTTLVDTTTIDPFKLAEYGYKIFPVKDKKPLVKWSVEASNDPAIIAEWIAKFPNCNWGIPTGSENGIAVIDIDTEEAEHWWASQWFIEGLSVATPSGGRHIFYTVDPEIEIQTNVSKIHDGVDVRGSGGYVVAYSDVLDGIPELPEAVLEILPERQVYTTEYIEGDKPLEAGDGEKRVLQNIIRILEELPRPWHKGAGYHNTIFTMSCWLWRIVNSPEYALNEEQAKALLLKHAPVRDGEGTTLNLQRWEDARKITEGQYAESPGDVPPLLDANDILTDKPNQEIERLYWDAKKRVQIKDLIRECRRSGYTKQEAYSIATSMGANHPRMPQWGNVCRIYDEAPTQEAVEEAAPLVKQEKPKKPTLLTEEERLVIDYTPNFVDRYVYAAKLVTKGGNKPLHWLNAWAVLASAMGDRGTLALKKKTRPLNLWCFLMAETASGKGDSRAFMEDTLDIARDKGFGSISVGSRPSREGLVATLLEMPEPVALMHADEAAALLEGFSSDRGSWVRDLRDTLLDLYDGKAYAEVRANTAKEDRGRSVETAFNMWLQTTWKRATETLGESDLQSGFIGRFIPAIGTEAVITDESLQMDFADEYQFDAGGRHPLVVALGESLHLAWKSLQPRCMMLPDSPEVVERHKQMRWDVLNHIHGHPLEDSLRGIVLRVTENSLKAAALLALSERRKTITMTDLLIAIRSTEYWVRDMILWAEAIASDSYRKRVEYLVAIVESKPRSRSQILNYGVFRNLRTFEVDEIINRAEEEGHIVRDGAKWMKA